MRLGATALLAPLLLAPLLLSTAAAAQDAPALGRRLFEPCTACHSREAGKPGMAGPDLAGLAGRVLGGAAGFDYSPVLRRARAAGAVWDEARLLAFLEDPEAMFPGMWMSSGGIADPAERQALARYLLSRDP